MAQGEGEDRPAPLWTAHFVRGLIDTASPLGVRWVDEGSCDDPFAQLVNRAQASLITSSELERPDGSGPVGEALAGKGRSPSLVWHAQAIGVLLEFGFLPTTTAVRRHLDILKWRLDPNLLRDPAAVDDPNDPWILRTRHVAWVVACLAELPFMRLEPHDEAREKANFDAAMELHREVLLDAAQYLLGLRESHSWTGPDFEAQAWREHWGTSRPNMLNTIYAAIGVSRAMRHGWLRATGPFAEVLPKTAELLDTLFNQVAVVSDGGQPQVRWFRSEETQWVEPWAHDDLPDGIVGLLCLALLEYAGMLRETQGVYSYDDAHGAALRTKAQRLGHVLVFRARDRSRLAKGAVRWTAAAEAFLSEGAEGEWFVPSYSVCARAILESGAATTRSSVVRDAAKTIEAMSLRPGRRGETWSDPTRATAIRREARAGGKQTWHAKVAVRSAVGEGADAPADRHVTPAGIHAAAMSLASIRRAAAREDPRDLLKQVRHNARPASPFVEFYLHDGGATHRLELRGVGDKRDRYIEHASISTESRVVIEALARLRRPAAPAEIAEAVASLAAGRRRHVKVESGVEDRIDKLNRQLGVEFIARDDEDGELRFVLRAALAGR